MSAKRDYWSECIAIAAEECGLTLTPEQLECLADGAESGHEHYGMAFYSPPPSDRLNDIEREWKAKLKAQQDEHERYMRNAETAVLCLRRKGLMMDDPNMYAYGDHYPDDSDQPLPLPPEGHPLRKLGQRLTELLDEDHWAECERLLLEGWEHDRIDRKTGADWRQNSSLEIWFPFTAKELARWKRAAEANIEENVRLRADLDELRHNAGGKRSDD